MGGRGKREADAEKPREGRLARWATVATALAAIIGLPSVAITLYNDIEGLRETVDTQSAQLKVQEAALRLQAEQLATQKAQMEQQKAQFLALRNLTAPHYAHEETRDYLERLDEAIAREESSPYAATFSGAAGRIAEARRLYAQAEEAWRSGNYTRANVYIDAAYDVLAGGAAAGAPDPAAEANKAIAGSLDVERDGDANLLTWSPQPGAAGYQVFVARGGSSYALLETLRGDSVATYRDPGGTREAYYVVTAHYSEGAALDAGDVNAGKVPGYTRVPAGENADGASQEAIPAPSPALLLGLVVAAAALLARRRPG